MRKDELTNCLDQVFDFMSGKGVQFSNDNKESIIDDLSSALENAVSPQEMNDGNFQKKLMHTINSKLLGNDNEYDAMKKTLSGDDKTTNLDANMQTKADASSILVMTMSTLLPGKDGKKDGDPEKASDKMTDLVTRLTNFTKNLRKKMGQKEKGQDKNEEPSKPEQEQLEATLRNLNGGDNPSVDGEHQFPILGPIFGDLMASTNQCAADPNSVSLMKESITYDPGEGDPLGQEIKSKAAEISRGGELDINPSKPSPFNTSPQ